MAVNAPTREPWAGLFRPLERDERLFAVLLAFVMVRAFRGHFTPEEHRGVEVPGIYWHFVDIMWVIVYTTIYVI